MSEDAVLWMKCDVFLLQIKRSDGSLTVMYDASNLHFMKRAGDAFVPIVITFRAVVSYQAVFMHVVYFPILKQSWDEIVGYPNTASISRHTTISAWHKHLHP